MSTTVRQSPRQSSRSQTRRDSNESVGRSRSRSLDRLDSDAATKLSMPTRSQAGRRREQNEPYPVSSVGVVTADAAGTPAMMPVITPQTRGVADPSTSLMPPPSPVRRVLQRPEPASPRDRRLEIREQHKDSIASTKTMDFTPLESCDPSMLRKCTDGKHIVSSPDVESDVPIVKAAGTREGECDNGVSEEERISADAYHRSQAKQEHARESVAALTRGGLVLGPGFARGSCLLQRPQSRATSVSESRSNNACAQHDIGALLSNARAQLH